MTLHYSHPRQRGFSMLEVLIAVLVFSLGMIGLAGLLVFSIQSNHVAYLRTQATFLAQSMASRMGANPVGVWDGSYSKPILAAGEPVQSCDNGCTPDVLAAHDLAAWSQQLHTFLPAVTGGITCATTGISYSPSPTQYNFRPPYGGTCTMTLTWNEAGTNGQGQQPHTFQWVFQP